MATRELFKRLSPYSKRTESRTHQCLAYLNANSDPLGQRKQPPSRTTPTRYAAYIDHPKVIEGLARR